MTEFQRAISTGRAVLVLGDHFIDPSHPDLFEPTFIDSLRSTLARVSGLTGEPSVGALNLGQLLATARSTSAEEQAAGIRRCKSAGLAFPDEWKRLLQAPWQRIYDLVGSFASIAKELGLEYVDGTDDKGLDRRKTQAIDLARLESPALDSSSAASDSPTETWYRQFCADIVSHPVVLVAAQTHPEFWEFLAARRGAPEAGVSPGLLCCDQILPSDLALARSHWLQVRGTSIAQLASEALPSQPSTIEGKRRFAQVREAQGLTGTRPLLVESLMGEDRDIPLGASCEVTTPRGGISLTTGQ